MSIFIKGMELPESCGMCDSQGLKNAVWHFGYGCKGDTDDFCNCPPSDCPIVPFPEKHGRLGDLDALEAIFREEALKHTCIGDLNRMTLGVGDVIDRIRMADTIVPAEGEKE